MESQNGYHTPWKMRLLELHVLIQKDVESKEEDV